MAVDFSARLRALMFWMVPRTRRGRLAALKDVPKDQKPLAGKRLNELKAALEADAVLFGSVGGPKWDTADFSKKPERGLLRLRKEMDLFSNLRPAQCFDALADFSSLKKDVVAGLDIVIVRELTSGIYFGEPRGIFTEGNERVGVNTQRYTESEIARVARSAFELARKRGNKVCSMEKANVMESGILWRDVVQEIHDKEYPDVELSHMYADAGAMQLCRWPKQFDVIVTDNLFGDVLSDMAAMLTGSLGMLPSASLGLPMANGRPKALYEPVHGSAPDIAGQGKANPIACILSFAMALRYSFGMGEDATRVEKAVEKVLADGLRTAVEGDDETQGRGCHRPISRQRTPRRKSRLLADLSGGRGRRQT